MKNFHKLSILIAFILMLAISANAQSTPDTTKADTTKVWKIGAVTSFTISQTQLKYWAAGGDNTFGINGLLNAHANYKFKKHSWKNTLEAAYGTQSIGNKGFRKTEDKIDFASKYGYKAINKFYYTGLYNFKTQFYDGFEYNENDEATKISGLFAPAYMLYSAGIDYLPNDHFAIYTSPATGKLTIVNDLELSKQSAFGVDSAKTFRNEIGAYIKFEYQKEAWKNITINSKLDLFSNYLENPQNIDMNFNLLVSMKVNKFLTVNVTTELIYDDDVKVLVDSETGKKGPRLQLKETMGIGVSFNF